LVVNARHPETLRRDLDKAGRDYFDAVCITHTDTDHCKGFGEFFWLDHAALYQGKDRIKIRELWVPAAAILEENLKDDARVARAPTARSATGPRAPCGNRPASWPGRRGNVRRAFTFVHGHGGRLGGEGHHGRRRIAPAADVGLSLLSFIFGGVRTLEIFLAALTRSTVPRLAAARRRGKQHADPPSGFTPYEHICKIRTSEPGRFIVGSIHQMPGLNS